MAAWTWVWMRNADDSITSRWLDAQRQLGRAEADRLARLSASEGLWDTWGRAGGVSLQARRVFLCDYLDSTGKFGPYREIKLAPVNRLARWRDDYKRAMTATEYDRARQSPSVSGPLGAERTSKFWTGSRWTTVTWWDPDASPTAASRRDRRGRAQVGEPDGSSSSKGGVGPTVVLGAVLVGAWYMFSRRKPSPGVTTTSGRPLFGE